MGINDGEAQNDDSRESGSNQSTEIIKYEDIENTFSSKKMIISENCEQNDQRKQSFFDFDIMNASAHEDFDLDYLINQINEDISK